MKAVRLLAALVTVGSLVSLWGIWWVSRAHGHGLASQDRNAMLVLAVVAFLGLVGFALTWRGGPPGPGGGLGT